MNYFLKTSILLAFSGLLVSSPSYSRSVALEIFCQNGKVRNDNALNFLLSSQDDTCIGQEQDVSCHNNDLEIESALNRLHYVGLLSYSEWNEKSDVLSRIYVDCEENKLIEVEKTIVYQDNGEELISFKESEAKLKYDNDLDVVTISSNKKVFTLSLLSTKGIKSKYGKKIAMSKYNMTGINHHKANYLVVHGESILVNEDTSVAFTFDRSLYPLGAEMTFENMFDAHIFGAQVVNYEDLFTDISKI